MRWPTMLLLGWIAAWETGMGCRPNADQLQSSGTVVLNEQDASGFSGSPAASGLGGERDAASANEGRETGESPQVRPALPRRMTNSIGMSLVLIPAGEFSMGSPDSEADRGLGEGPQHQVRITKPFYLGACEVTQGEYESVMGRNPSRFKLVLGQDTARFPVEQVSWHDALEFCRHLSEADGRSYRLPTEAEWEYACRAGTTTPFSFGDVLDGHEANCDGNEPYCAEGKGPYLRRPTPVGSYAANAFGLHDMHGNVYEWCADWYDANYYASSPCEDPQGPESGEYRVTRGGCWFLSARLCRSAYRRECPAQAQYSFLGFRVALDLADQCVPDTEASPPQPIMSPKPLPQEGS